MQTNALECNRVRNNANKVQKCKKCKEMWKANIFCKRFANIVQTLQRAQTSLHFCMTFCITFTYFCILLYSLAFVHSFAFVCTRLHTFAPSAKKCKKVQTKICSVCVHANGISKHQISCGLLIMTLEIIVPACFKIPACHQFSLLVFGIFQKSNGR
jgi:hypothetical protein